MLCKRCGRDFDMSDLRPPSLILRLLAAPFFLPFLVKSGVLRQEITAYYCRPCRRQLSFCFFFGAFMAFVVIFMGMIIVMQKLGLIARRVP